MDKLDQIHNEIITLQNMFAAGFLLLLIFMSGVVMYLREFKNRHTIQNMTSAAYQLVVKHTKKLHKVYQNLGGAETKPDALPMLEKFVAEYWLETTPRITSFAEPLWLPIIRAENFTRPEWVQLMKRWKADGIVRKKDPNAKTGKGTALIAARGEIGMERKMRVIAGKAEG